jgi:UDP-GlcNAc:undecaprenyl-phosphate/decaprenyl-phosphate GlcNAc-1-phosphate transferase
MNLGFTLLVISFSISLICILYILKLGKSLGGYFAGFNYFGVQRFHHGPTPRTGGVALFTAVCTSGSLYIACYDKPLGMFILLLLLAASPVFFFGLLEDLTGRVPARVRFLAAIVASYLGIALLGATINEIEISIVDRLLINYGWISIVLTCFAISGVTHSLNIIDGFNGLAGTISLCIFGAIAYVAFKVEDTHVMMSALVMASAVLGFLTYNYPKGKIFLGDAGAYLVGFWIAELAVLLTTRNMNVSKWFPLLLCIYPVAEVLYTIKRRLRRGVSIGDPDSKHLHQLIFRILNSRSLRTGGPQELWSANARVMPVFLALQIVITFYALYYWPSRDALRLGVVLFIFSYLLIYLWALRKTNEDTSAD